MSKSTPWFKCFPESWLDATRKLSPDHRGLYFDALCLIYKADGKLRDDDLALAHHMHVHWRTWRAAKENLIAHGFLHVSGGYLANKKAQKVLRERADKRQKLRKNASGSPHKALRNSTSADKIWVGTEQLLKKPNANSEQLPTDREKERKIDINPPTPQGGWRADDISFENGALILRGAAHAYWLERCGFDHERLELALVEASSGIQPNSRRPLEAQAGKQLASYLLRKKDSDARHERSLAARSAGALSAGERKVQAAREFLEKARGVKPEGKGQYHRG